MNVDEMLAARETAAAWMNRATQLRALLALADAVIDAARAGGGPAFHAALVTYDAAKGRV